MSLFLRGWSGTEKKTLDFEALINKPEVQWLNDEKYRVKALNEVFELSRKWGTSFSLVDCVLREVLKNKDFSIECLVTYNKKDFQDVCEAEKITIINS